MIEIFRILFRKMSMINVGVLLVIDVCSDGVVKRKRWSVFDAPFCCAAVRVGGNVWMIF